MWKIIIIGIFLVTNINFCFANPTTTNNMLEEFNCLYYKVDDGLEYYTFKSNSQNIRVNIKKIKKNNPEAQADIDYLLGICTDITALWYIYNQNCINTNMYEALYRKYAMMFRKIMSEGNTVRSQDAIVWLIHESNKKASELQKAYTTDQD